MLLISSSFYGIASCDIKMRRLTRCPTWLPWMRRQSKIWRCGWDTWVMRRTEFWSERTEGFPVSETFCWHSWRVQLAMVEYSSVNAWRFPMSYSFCWHRPIPLAGRSLTVLHCAAGSMFVSEVCHWCWRRTWAWKWLTIFLVDAGRFLARLRGFCSCIWGLFYC